MTINAERMFPVETVKAPFSAELTAAAEQGAEQGAESFYELLCKSETIASKTADGLGNVTEVVAQAVTEEIGAELANALAQAVKKLVSDDGQTAEKAEAELEIVDALVSMAKDEFDGGEEELAVMSMLAELTAAVANTPETKSEQNETPLLNANSETEELQKPVHLSKTEKQDQPENPENAVLLNAEENLSHINTAKTQDDGENSKADRTEEHHKEKSKPVQKAETQNAQNVQNAQNAQNAQTANQPQTVQPEYTADSQNSAAVNGETEKIVKTESVEISAKPQNEIKTTQMTNTVQSAQTENEKIQTENTAQATQTENEEIQAENTVQETQTVNTATVEQIVNDVESVPEKTAVAEGLIEHFVKARQARDVRKNRIDFMGKSETNQKAETLSSRGERSVKIEGAAREILEKIKMINSQGTQSQSTVQETEKVFAEELFVKRPFQIKEKPDELKQLLDLTAETGGEKMQSVFKQPYLQRTFTAFGETKAILPMHEASRIGAEITAHIANLKDGTVEFEMTLNPEELGKIVIKLTVKGSRVVADITAEKATTAEMLKGSMDRINLSLEKSGAQLETYTVKYEPDYTGREQQRQQQEQNAYEQEQPAEEEPDENALSFADLIANF